MAQPKVLKYGLEQLVVQLRGEGKSNAQVAAACNTLLARRKPKDSLTPKAIERYLARLDKASVPAAHTPAAAEQNVQIAIDFAGRLTRLDALLKRWLEEADEAVIQMRGVRWDPYRGRPMPDKQNLALSDAHADAEDDDGKPMWANVVDVFVPDWTARTSVAREVRGLLKNYVDLMERIHHAEEVRAFQLAVTEAIRDADPDTAARVLANMRRHQSIARAAVLGAAA